MSASLPPTTPGNRMGRPDPAQQLLARQNQDRTMDLASWGVLFVWIGFAYFAAIDWSWTMVGIGVVFLVEALIRGALSLKVSGMAIFFGIVFLGGGFWHMAQAPWMLIPAMFMLFGVAMVVRAITSLFRQRGQQGPF